MVTPRDYLLLMQPLKDESRHRGPLKIWHERVPGASHWIVHEQPGLVAAEIERFLIAHRS